MYNTVVKIFCTPEQFFWDIENEDCMWRAVVVVLHDGGEDGLARLSGIKKRRSEKKLLEMLKTTVLEEAGNDSEEENNGHAGDDEERRE